MTAMMEATWRVPTLVDVAAIVHGMLYATTGLHRVDDPCLRFLFVATGLPCLRGSMLR